MSGNLLAEQRNLNGSFLLDRILLLGEQIDVDVGYGCGKLLDDDARRCRTRRAYGEERH